MRWGLISVRITIMVISVITTLLLLLAVVPLMDGGLDIRFPDDRTNSWSYDNSTNVVSFETPVQIYNGGFFDFQEFSIGIKLTDHNGTLISTSNSPPMDLLAGRTNFVNVRMALDLNDLGPSVLRELAFNYTTLNMSLSLASNYMDNMVNIHIGTNSTMDWTPLIDNMQVDLQGLQIQQNGTGYDIEVPYSFEAGNMIVGQQAGIRTVLHNSSNIIGAGSETIRIDKDNSGLMEITVSPAVARQLFMNPDNLSVDVTIDFQGAIFTQTYGRAWTPLISDLRIGSPEVSRLPTLSVDVPYGYNATGAIVGKTMQLEFVLSNSTGQISDGTGSSIILYQNSGSISEPFTIAQSSWFLRHSDAWTITLRATIMGITVEQSRPYQWTAPLGGP